MHEKTNTRAMRVLVRHRGSNEIRHHSVQLAFSNPLQSLEDVTRIETNADSSLLLLCVRHVLVRLSALFDDRCVRSCACHRSRTEAVTSSSSANASITSCNEIADKSRTRRRRRRRRQLNVAAIRSAAAIFRRRRRRRRPT